MNDSKADVTDKSSTVPKQIPVNSRSSTLYILQLFVAVTSCFVSAVCIQRYYNQTGTLGLLDWLTFIDGITGLGLKTDCLKSSLFSWPGKQFLQVISLITAWCSTYYISCLLTSLITEICVMYFISKSQWHSETCSICCLSWVCLMLLSAQKSEQWLIYSMLLSALTCVGSIYLLLVLMFGNKIFGQRRKKKRKVRESKIGVENSTELQITNNQEQQCAKKLKLPEELDELELAEENLSHDENICMSSLSLGPCGIKNGITHNNNGSWFRKELNGSFKDGSDSSVSSSGSTTLIRPARFYVNGLSVCAKTTTNNPTSVSKTSVGTFGEFSDDEGSLFHRSNLKTEEKGNIPDSSASGERLGWRTICDRCHIQRVVLVCSLTLNIIFLWIWTKS
ncbi:uncharacterized protein LOC114521823 [Dendronephthya gigantea]|uniref:uncharacterized protein LOC114521823 n=1 Tax=Dendronephthya gigantea TaxID=151771 RepID=UPI00106AF969|nr:uncharacterized protein LOC114521823 [Dendronephthya gigantea]